MRAADVRARNAALDAELLRLADEVTPESLHAARATPGGGEEWTVAQLLGHLGEFPRFFAADLGAWIDDPGVEVGRTMEHPVRLAAVEGASSAELAALRSGVEVAFAELAATLGRLTDDHVAATTRNRKYGEEPLTAYLDRYVLGHKAAHAEQLRRASNLGAPRP